MPQNYAKRMKATDAITDYTKRIVCEVVWKRSAADICSANLIANPHDTDT